MGVDCRIILPAAVRIDDVADVIGALSGSPNVKREFGGGHDGYSVGQPSGSTLVRVESVPKMASCAYINFDPPEGEKFIDGCTGHYAMYHFEGSRRGERLMMPPSTAFWIALGRGLVDFFGGTLDYSDCDASDVDYSQPERPDIHAESGDEWYALQDRKLAVKALTKADLKACAKFAEYKG